MLANKQRNARCRGDAYRYDIRKIIQLYITIGTSIVSGMNALKLIKLATDFSGESTAVM